MTSADRFCLQNTLCQSEPGEEALKHVLRVFVISLFFCARLRGWPHPAFGRAESGGAVFAKKRRSKIKPDPLKYKQTELSRQGKAASRSSEDRSPRSAVNGGDGDGGADSR